MFYTIYQITNLANGKVYVGMHQTDDLEDGYLGSGTAIRRAVAKYGTDQFSKEYIAVYNNREEMISHERLLVNEDFLKRRDTYNIKLGGQGGWDHITENAMLGRKHREESKTAIAEGYKKFWQTLSEAERKRRMSALIEASREHCGKSFAGKTHSEESRRKIGEANKRFVGEKNHRFGRVWIHEPNTLAAQTILKEELTNFLSNGWVLGRKPKKPKPVRVPKSSAAQRERIKRPTPLLTQAGGRVNKVTDEEYLEALRTTSSICQALIKLGLAPKGKNYTRAKRLLGYSTDTRLNTNGTPKI